MISIGGNIPCFNIESIIPTLSASGGDGVSDIATVELGTLYSVAEGGELLIEDNMVRL